MCVCVCVCVCVYAKLLQSCLTLWHTMDHSLPGSSVCEDSQGKNTRVGCMPSSREFSWPRDQTCLSYVTCIGRQALYHWLYLGSIYIRRMRYILSSVQSLNCFQLFVTPWTAACQASLSMSIESVMPSNHLTVHCPFLPPSHCPSIRVFFSESVLCIRWPKYWSFSIRNIQADTY